MTAYGRRGHGHGMADGPTVRHGYRAHRRDGRRERRLHRRHGRGAVFGLALVLGVVVAFVGISIIIVRVIFELFWVLVLVALLGTAFVLVRRALRGSGPQPVPVTEAPAAESGVQAWSSSTRMMP